MPTPKKLHVNLAWLYAGTLTARLLSMAAYVYLMRTLGKEVYGDLEFALSVWLVLMLVQDAGLGPYGSREGARHPERLGEIVGTIVTLQLCAFVVSVGLLTGLLFHLDRSPTAETLVALFAGVLALAPFELIWAFQSRDETGVIAVTEILRYVIFTALVFLCVSGPQDVVYVPVAEACGLAFLTLVQNVVLRRRISPVVFRGAFTRARTAVRAALPLAASSFTWALRTQLPLLALYLSQGGEASGDYAAAQRLVLPAHMFVFLYSFNLLPSLSRAAARPDREEYRRLMRGSLRLIAWIVLPGCLVVTALAPFVFPLVAGAQFVDGVLPFQVMVWMLAVAFFTFHMRYALLAHERQRDEFVSMLIGLVAGAAALLVLAAQLSSLVAAAVFLGAEVVSLVAASRLLTVRVESAGALRIAAVPFLVTAVSGFVALALFHERPAVAAVVSLALCAVGLLVFDRGLVRDARGVLAGMRGKAP